MASCSDPNIHYETPLCWRPRRVLGPAGSGSDGDEEKGEGRAQGRICDGGRLETFCFFLNEGGFRAFVSYRKKSTDLETKNASQKD